MALPTPNAMIGKFRMGFIGSAVGTMALFAFECQRGCKSIYHDP
jgi:hypothetical protein